MSPEDKRKRKQTTIAWDNNKKELWDKLAASYKLGPSVYARFCLEEIMALQLPRAELVAAGMERIVDQRPGYYIPRALKEFAAVSGTAVNPVPGGSRSHGPSIVGERRRRNK